MLLTRRPHTYALPLLWGSLTLACSDDDADAFRPPVGTLEVTWTIEGDSDEESCDEYDAEALEIVLLDQRYYIREFEFPCEEFSAELELVVDDYWARMTLVDVQDFPVTERIISSTFFISAAEVEELEVDFPDSAFN